MATLLGRKPSETYGNLLQIDNSNTGVDTTLRDVQDGEGTVSALQLSTTSGKITGTLEVTSGITIGGVTVNAGVATVLSDVAPQDPGTAAAGTNNEASRSDHVHNADMSADTTPQLGGDLDCNGNQIQWSKGADVASAAALAVLTDGNYFDVTGTTTVTSINTTGGAGTLIKLHFDDAVTLTHHATNLILPGGANITTAAGDEFEFLEYGAGTYRCTGYALASGKPVVDNFASLVGDTTPQLGGDLDCNGSQIQWSKGADVASGTALPILTDGNYFDVTGTTTITSIDTTGTVGTLIKLHFDGILTLTHHATNLVLPSGANITTAAGDEFEFLEYSAGAYRCTGYALASGKSIVGVTAAFTDTDHIVEGSADATKTVRMEVDGLTTATERVITMPDQNVDLTPTTGTFQGTDATLTSIAALGTAADKFAYTTGVDTWAEASITAAGRAILDDAAASDQRTTLGLVIGTDVQAFDADTLKADTADTLTAGFNGTDYDLGTITSGTTTPAAANGNFQKGVNGGAFTFAPQTATSTIIVQFTNNSQAGAVTTSGFTLVDGDTISTTDGDDFHFYCTLINGFSHLHVKALQ